MIARIIYTRTDFALGVSVRIFIKCRVNVVVDGTVASNHVMESTL